MTAKIGLQDVRIHAPHGFFAEEHRMGNEFSIDVEVDARIGGAAREDDLGQTVNYATIYYLLKAEMKQPTQLLETLAYRMAERIADQFDNVTAVKLRLHKLNPPLGGKVGASWVEVSVQATGAYGRGGFDEFGPAVRSPHTFEDYKPQFDVDGPFAPSSGGGRRGIVEPRPGHPPFPPSQRLPPEDDEPFDFDFDDGERLMDLDFDED